VLVQWLRTLAPADFLAQVYLKTPYSVAEGAVAYTGLLSWKTLWEVLPRCDDADVLVVRDGRLWRGPDPRTPEEGRALFGDGYSLVLRHAERHDEGLRRLADEVSADFRAPVAIQLYATPSGRSSFGWHYDAEEVFILQTAGSKRYLLRENTVRPHPLLEAIPQDQQFERETSPTMRCDLASGDWLYVPSGMWHIAKAEADALSISIGVAAASAIDLYDALRPVLAESPSWRQRLPLAGDAVRLLDELRDEVARILADRALMGQLIERTRQRARPGNESRHRLDGAA
jgi:50S ribosomal protein L16 3-hydroxylase